MEGNESYWSAVVPEPFTILGLTLTPFSAGKILLLHRTQNVFALGGDVTREHLTAAVFICAQPFAEAVAALNDPDTPKFFAKWAKKIGDFNLFEKKELFLRYIEDGSRFPLCYVPKQNNNQVPITDLPAVHSVRCRLKHYYHTTDAEFWDMPWGLALWDFYTIPVMEGRGDLVESQAIESAQEVAHAMFRKFNPHLFPVEQGKPTETASNA